MILRLGGLNIKILAYDEFINITEGSKMRSFIQVFTSVENILRLR